MNVNALVPARGWSLQKALLLAVLGFTVLAWLEGGMLVAQLAQRATTELHDRELERLAQLLLGLSAHEIDEIESSTTILARVANGRADAQVLGDDYRYQIWSDEGELLLTNFGETAPAALARFGNTGFGRAYMDGEYWRIYAMVAKDLHKEIQIAERERMRQWLWAGMGREMGALMLVSLVVIVIPALWVLRRLMQPLRVMAAALEARTPANLEPLVLRRTPQEFSPVVSALNNLLARLRAALDRERGFTAVAAHELRTPLASLRILAQLARSADGVVERDDALDGLIQGADRCAHLQEQLLTLQRLDAANAAEMDEAVDLTDVVMEAIGAVRMEAQRRGITVVGHVDGSSIRGHRFGVLTLLRNLLSNGVAYTPRGGRVEISTRHQDRDVTVVVDDSGVGIAPADRERAFERFERLGAVSGAGAGLGLSIVRAVADAHGASIVLDDSPLGGLRVSACFVGRADGAVADLLDSLVDDAPDASGPASVPGA